MPVQAVPGGWGPCSTGWRPPHLPAQLRGGVRGVRQNEPDEVLAGLWGGNVSIRRPGLPRAGRRAAAVPAPGARGTTTSAGSPQAAGLRGVYDPEAAAGVHAHRRTWDGMLREAERQGRGQRALHLLHEAETLRPRRAARAPAPRGGPAWSAAATTRPSAAPCCEGAAPGRAGRPAAWRSGRRCGWAFAATQVARRQGRPATRRTSRHWWRRPAPSRGADRGARRARAAGAAAGRCTPQRHRQVYRTPASRVASVPSGGRSRRVVGNARAAGRLPAPGGDRRLGGRRRAVAGRRAWPSRHAEHLAAQLRRPSRRRWVLDDGVRPRTRRGTPAAVSALAQLAVTAAAAGRGGEGAGEVGGSRRRTSRFAVAGEALLLHVASPAGSRAPARTARPRSPGPGGRPAARSARRRRSRARRPGGPRRRGESRRPRPAVGVREGEHLAGARGQAGVASGVRSPVANRGRRSSAPDRRGRPGG